MSSTHSRTDQARIAIAGRVAILGSLQATSPPLRPLATHPTTLLIVRTHQRNTRSPARHTPDALTISGHNDHAASLRVHLTSRGQVRAAGSSRNQAGDLFSRPYPFSKLGMDLLTFMSRTSTKCRRLAPWPLFSCLAPLGRSRPRNHGVREALSTYFG